MNVLVGIYKFYTEASDSLMTGLSAAKKQPQASPEGKTLIDHFMPAESNGSDFIVVRRSSAAIVSRVTSAKLLRSSPCKIYGYVKHYSSFFR